ncbi:hypothetical protein FMEAI12_5510011 [Parafrankia sp. Ea1.12]|nr:hypothetical protein FMEAI12_5510011 [Parafrankia sp. Ea1.12]
MIAGLFLPDGHADFTTLLRRKDASGVKIRYALDLRGQEEGIGDGLAALTRITLTYLAGMRDGQSAMEHRQQYLLRPNRPGSLSVFWRPRSRSRGRPRWRPG